MGWRSAAGLTLLSLSLGPARTLRPYDEPLPALDLKLPEPPGDVWVKRRAHSTAIRVRLNGLGASTHANWVLFRLPFDADDEKRIRGVSFSIQQTGRTDVGAVIFGSVCADFPSRGGVDEWSSYTTSGIAWTQRYDWHMAPPTDDATILGLNVPTRVANYVACGRDDGHLSSAENWSLDIRWEER